MRNLATLIRGETRGSFSGFRVHLGERPECLNSAKESALEQRIRNPLACFNPCVGAD